MTSLVEDQRQTESLVTISKKVTIRRHFLYTREKKWKGKFFGECVCIIMVHGGWILLDIVYKQQQNKTYGETTERFYVGAVILSLLLSVSSYASANLK